MPTLARPSLARGWLALGRFLTRVGCLLAACAACGVGLTGCPRPSNRANDGDHAGTAAEANRSTPRPAPRTPAGATCSGRNDCTADQVCVDDRCRYRQTSAAGEVLWRAATAQVEAGDSAGATRTFGEAAAAFEAAGAPVPPALLCERASTALGVASSLDARERAVTAADQCLRSSLPGDTKRTDTARALARLRYDGLDLALLDRPMPADRYFVREPSRPTVDAVTIEMTLTEQDYPGFTAIRQALDGDEAKRAIAECFVQDWELHHERTTSAALVLRYTSRTRDAGGLETFAPELEVAQTSLAEDGFEPCCAEALTAALGPGPRLGRAVTAWQLPLSLEARMP